MSQRSMPATLPESIDLDDRRVGRSRNNGCLRRGPNGRPIDLPISIAFASQLAVVRPSATDGIFHVWLGRYRIAQLTSRKLPNFQLSPISSRTRNPGVRPVQPDGPLWSPTDRRLDRRA